MLKPKAKTKVKKFLKHIENLKQNSTDTIVDGYETTEKVLITQLLLNTYDLIEHNEWGVGLENLLSNLYEYEFPLDSTAIDLAKDAIRECEIDYNKWAFIEELAK